MTTPPRFFEIGARTNFSFLEGASHPEEMVEAAADLHRQGELSGLGIADRNSVAGVVRAHGKHKEIQEENPLRLQPGARLAFADTTPEILVFPRNRPGWGRLCRLLSTGNLRSEKGRCTLFFGDLLEWGGDMMMAVLPKRNVLKDTESGQAFSLCLTRLRERFGRHVHLALTAEYDGQDAFAFAGLAAMAAKARIPLIATNQPLYHHPARRPLSDVVTAIREHVTVQEAGFRFAANAERFLKPASRMAGIFRRYPEAVANTVPFFEELTFSLSELSHNYPEERILGEAPCETLERLTYEGARQRYGTITDRIERQIREELQLICDKQYAPYFLTVRRIMDFARSQNILCQGRGSAANSIICYCLHITDVDPIKSSLLFARFLSTERHEPPDIDVDFEHERREEVIQFIYRTYGREHAGLAAAVTSYRTRSAGREVAKAFGLSQDVQSALSSTIWGWSTDGLSDREARNAGLDPQDQTTKRVLSYAQEIMNFPRHLTQHVGGFVMTRDRLDEVVPIMPTAMPDRYMIEWNKDDLDALGILKVDILALGMLTCLAKAFRLLETHYGHRKTLASVIDDQQDAVYDMICRADTIGVFQIESRAQMSMLPRLRPREFYDLVIEVAIVRPGPIQGDMVHPYLKRREERRRTGKEVIYPKQELKEVLERTLGVPLFQEQAMQIAIVAAEFSASEADRLRRAMATFKRTGKVHDFRDKMVGNMIRRGYERDFAERCFSQIEGFGEYGFPESHAASFALLVYVSCWFKAFYPDVFLAAILNAQPMGFYAPAQLVRDAREHGIEVLPVDVNFSDWDAALEEGTGFQPRRMTDQHRSMTDVIRSRKSVRLGLRLVKGLSEADIRQKLVPARGKGYRSIRDLWLRSGLNRSVIEKLAEADAFRSLGLDRRRALWEVRALDARQASESLPLFEQFGRDDLQTEPAMVLPEMPPGEQVIEDYRSLTLSLKAHPVSFLRPALQKRGFFTTASLRTAQKNRRIDVAGLVLIRQRPGTAKVIFMTLEDETGVTNAIIRPQIFARYRSVVMAARLVRIRGLLQRESDVIHVIADHIEDLTPMLGLLEEDRRRFGLCERADEVIKATTDHREGKSRNAVSTSGGRTPAAQHGANPQENARVLPRGRNFH